MNDFLIFTITLAINQWTQWVQYCNHSLNNNEI